MRVVYDKEGLDPCIGNALSASVFINDDESGLHHDYEVWFEELAPHAPIRQYRHNDTGEDNADAHLKRQIMGREVVVAVTEGRLDGPTEPSTELTPGARRSLWHVGADLGGQLDS
jgi:thiamine phosphate synthase YjbQ (UPF0047 family)